MSIVCIVTYKHIYIVYALQIYNVNSDEKIYVQTKHLLTDNNTLK